MGEAKKTLNIEDPDALHAYLAGAGHIDASLQLQHRILPGGVSNRTVLVSGLPGGGSWVIKQALEKLRVAVDWFSDPMRIHRETEGLRWYARLAPPGRIPGFVFEDFSDHVLAMQAVPQPHLNWKDMLLGGQLKHAHVEQFAVLLGTVHAAAGSLTDQLQPAFADREFFESLRLEPYYHYTGTQVPEAAEFIQALIDDTRREILTLVHGDYSPKNVLVYQDNLILLDFEVAHLGDPGFDIGFACTHFLSKANHLHEQRKAFADAVFLFWNRYLDVLGETGWRANLEPRAVRHTLACMLARVAGRSPLEYLSDSQRARQQLAVTKLMAAPPDSFEQLVCRFLSGLTNSGN